MVCTRRAALSATVGRARDSISNCWLCVSLLFKVWSAKILMGNSLAYMYLHVHVRVYICTCIILCTCMYKCLTK